MTMENIMRSILKVCSIKFRKIAFCCTPIKVSWQNWWACLYTDNILKRMRFSQNVGMLLLSMNHIWPLVLVGGVGNLFSFGQKWCQRGEGICPEKKCFESKSTAFARPSPFQINIMFGALYNRIDGILLDGKLNARLSPSVSCGFDSLSSGFHHLNNLSIRAS